MNIEFYFEKLTKTAIFYIFRYNIKKSYNDKFYLIKENGSHLNNCYISETEASKIVPHYYYTLFLYFYRMKQVTGYRPKIQLDPWYFRYQR